MPYIEIDKSNENKGSVEALAKYLSKEEKETEKRNGIGFFDQEKEGVKMEEVIAQIDGNHEKLGKDEAKFFSLFVSPSELELAHLGNDDTKLKNYTRELMQAYAKNFNKGLNADDLLYFARIEHSRKLGRHDKEVKNGIGKIGDMKTGDNRHVHIIVSRKTRSRFVSGRRIIDGHGQSLAEDPDIEKRAMTIKISPKANARGGLTNKLNQKRVRVGFDRHNFKVKGEQLFDEMFGYQRQEHEGYEFMNDRRKGLLEKPINKLSDELEHFSTEHHRKIYVDEKLRQLEKKNHLHQSREAMDSSLKSNGIRYDGKSMRMNGRKVPLEILARDTKKFLDTVVSPIYFAKRTAKSLEGAQRDIDNEKEM